MTAVVERRETYVPSEIQTIPPVPPDLIEPDLNANAIEVMNRRIVPRDDNGTPLETPQECFWRVAWTVAGGSYPDDPDCNGKHLWDYQGGEGAGGLRRTTWYHCTRGSCELNSRRTLAREYYGMMARREFLPNSPCLVNAGRPLGQLSACFVLPVDDSIKSIYAAVGKAAEIHQSGGGTGFAFSRLRPNGSPVRTTSGVASGPVTFMRVFDTGTWAIKQGATRRGANMGILHIDHPDIWEFIELKGNLDAVSGVTPLENFNISVAVTDEFIRALEYARGDPDCDSEYIWKQSGHTVTEIWDRIAQNAWRTGDPGVIFIDRVNDGRSNPVPFLGPIEATNPCGEQPLYPYDSCNLGSINLERFVNREEHIVEFDRLRECVRLAVRFLDDVITVNRYPLPEIEELTQQIRRIGLGVMGWADTLIARETAYDDPYAVTLAETVMEMIQEAADEASEKLAEERGSFPLWDQSIYSDETYRPMRNSTRTTIAPTGTISIIAGCSSGIEPIFAPVFKRRHKLDRSDADAWFEMFDVNPAFAEMLDRFRIVGDERESILGNLANEVCTVTDLLDEGRLPQEFSLFRGANEIEAADHVRMQAAFQMYTDNGVSKTINLPEDTIWELVQHVYEDAYARGCKGITVYRHNCRSVQVLGGSAATRAATARVLDVPVHAPDESTAAVSALEELTQDFHVSLNGRFGPTRTKLPAERKSITHRFSVDGVDGYLTVGLYPDDRPGELFINVSKQGSTMDGLMDTVALLTSYALQYAIPLNVLCEKLRGVRFEPAGLTANRSIPTATSIIDYVFRWLDMKFLNAAVPATHAVDEPIPAVDLYERARLTGQQCPDCGSSLRYQEGCAKCPCGFSSC